MATCHTGGDFGCCTWCLLIIQICVYNVCPVTCEHINFFLAFWRKMKSLTRTDRCRSYYCGQHTTKCCPIDLPYIRLFVHYCCFTDIGIFSWHFVIFDNKIYRQKHGVNKNWWTKKKLNEENSTNNNGSNNIMVHLKALMKSKTFRRMFRKASPTTKCVITREKNWILTYVLHCC